MKKRFLVVVFILIANIFLCSCTNNQENILDEPIAVLTEEDKELSRTTVENFMNEICEFDIVNANQYLVDAQESNIDDSANIDINEFKQEILNSVKGSPLDDYRMEELLDKMFSQCSYDIANFEEIEDKYVYNIAVKMPDIGRFAQEIPKALNDDVFEEVIADCLYKGVLTEADLYREYLPADKEQAFMDVAVDKVIEILNKKVDNYVTSAKVKLTLTKQNGIWLIDRYLSDLDGFFEMFD